MNCIQEFLEAQQKEKLPVYLYGCGAAAIWYLQFADRYDITIDGIIDGTLNDREEYKWHGFRVSSLTHVSDECDCAHIIISAPAHRREIKKIIQDRKIPGWHVYTFDPTTDVLQRNMAAERRAYFKEHAKELQFLYDKLADDKSKHVLRQIIKGSLENNCDCYQDIAGESQYFPDFILRNLSEEAVFLDAGAYNGDTIRAFVEAVHHKYRKIYAFEPDKKNIEAAKKEFRDDKIVYFENGVGEKQEVCYLSNESNGIDGGARVVDCCSVCTSVIRTVRIDEIVHDNVTYLKMDIEGMELQALTGAKKLIQSCKPMLAVSVYHKTEDIVEIPKYICSLNSTYQLYLRHYWAHNGTDTVLFGV